MFEKGDRLSLNLNQYVYIYMNQHTLGILLVFLCSPLILSSPFGQSDLVIWFCGLSAGVSLLIMIGVARRLD